LADTISRSRDKNERLVSAGSKQRSEILRSWNRFKRYKPAVGAAIFLLILVLVAIFPAVFSPHSPTHVEILRRGESPSLHHPFGFDQIGRDVFSRVIYGTRIALLVGVAATAIAVVIGTAVGATAGYYGGRIDSVLSRFVDALMAFPLFVLLVTLAAVIGPGISTVVLVIGATVWAQYARVVRGDVMSLRERDFIAAARAAGANDFRIIARHIIPNIVTPVIVLASLSVGGIIILESALSFFGLGVQPPTPSWGNILSDGRALMRIHPHIAIAPGIMITITVLAFNLLGDGLRDAFDPRQRE
jgi:peptide/nickel transport system permease protein